MRQRMRSLLWLFLLLSLAPLTFYICFWSWLIFKLRPQFNTRKLKKPVVVILEGRTPQALHACRLFSAAGFRVIVCETNAPLLTCSAWSVHCHKCHRLPNPKTQPEAYITKLCTTVMNYKASLLIPMVKEHSTLDAQVINQLGDSVISMAFDAISFQELNDKITFYQGLEKQGIPCSEFQVIATPSQVKDVMLKPGRTKSFILKPVYKSSQVILPGDILVPGHNEQELNHFLESRPIGSSFPFLLQEQMEPLVFSTCSLVVNRKVIAHTCMPKHPGYKTIYHYDNGELEIWVENFVKNYPRLLTGWITIDFMRSRQDGHWYPINCQPRLSFQFLLYLEVDMVIKELLQQLHPQNHRHEAEVVIINQKLRRKLPIKPRCTELFWLFSEIYEGLICRKAPWTVGKKIVQLIYGNEAMFRFTDPLPFFTYNCLYLPILILRNFFTKNSWTTIDFSLGMLK